MLLAILYYAFIYFVPYSEGTRAGELIKFSRKGVISKRYSALRSSVKQNETCKIILLSVDSVLQKITPVKDIHDKKFITPYLTDSVKEFFYSKSWEELNTPSQKHHVRNAFGEFKLIKNIKKHLNLQIDCGIVDLFETLIHNKEINFKGRKRVMDICRDWNLLNSTNTLEEFFV